MAKKANWSDDYWLLLMQLYLQRPVGVKPMYSRGMVDLSLELHISPQVLHGRMSQLARLETPRIEYIWNTYHGSPSKLSRAVRLWREMRGYGNAEAFYEGVTMNETFERDFRPVADGQQLTPAMLILILNLYFHLTPITMVEETPEVRQLARLLKIDAALVVSVLEAYQQCDPYLNRREVDGEGSWLMPHCREVWRRYGNGDSDELAALAGAMGEYFKSGR